MYDSARSRNNLLHTDASGWVADGSNTHSYRVTDLEMAVIKDLDIIQFKHCKSVFFLEKLMEPHVFDTYEWK